MLQWNFSIWKQKKNERFWKTFGELQKEKQVQLHSIYSRFVSRILNKY